jgi:predicted RNase H-like HicB family nuclease
VQQIKVALHLRDQMKAESTAIIEAAPEDGYWAICPEISGANGQGVTIEETKVNVRQAIEMILDDRTADILRGLPKDAIEIKILEQTEYVSDDDYLRTIDDGSRHK